MEWSKPRDVEFRASVDASAQLYTEMLPAGFDAAAEHHVLIALHGHGSNRTQFIGDKRGECAGSRAAALKRGMIYVSPDYRAPDSWMGPKAEADLVQIIAELRKRHKVGKVFIVGGSMGGTSALIFTALHPDLVAGVASLNGTANMTEFAGFQESIARSYGGGKQDKPDEYRRRSPELVPEKFTMPAAITAGGLDKTVPPASVLRLAAAIQKANGKVLLIHREKGGHETSLEDTVAALEFVFAKALDAK
jgi:pimeloyl-ACP methyl ester carboxylesterase